MPGFLLHQGAIVMCMHGGMAQPTIVSTQVFVGGMPVVMQPAPWVVAGCPLPPVPPCVTAVWTTAATKVLSNLMPVLLLDSQAICAAPGTGVLVVTTQTRVAAT